MKADHSIEDRTGSTMDAFVCGLGKNVHARRIALAMNSASKGIKLALIDISGTLHVGSQAIQGGPPALKKLREAGVTVKFVTNTSKESSTDLHSQLTGLGYDVAREDIHSSLGAASLLVRKMDLHPLLLLSESARMDFEKDYDYSCADSVVVGLGPERLTYEWLNRAFRILDKGGQLIAAHDGRYFKQEDGLSLGPGAFVHGLEYCTGKKALVVGKPSREFFLTAFSSDLAVADEVVMIGDDATSDCSGALNAGIGNAVLVQTGKYRSGDEEKAKPPPTATVPDFAAAVEWIINNS
ncbi:hypothetical protein NDN08_007745 [Rhodosorus marinus]|uniref:Haloacid dehalogenase-like hydrolase domain-containing protein 2 n=1 Tax=Rhodosorus marinus TaxID=101924 RepID=A0AAV8V187_9RHOD|nr:hypothetical protein NDN08_007745 [Rhodosorus marinus]